MKLAQARAMAEEVVKAIAPYCHRVEIAGSIRRLKAEVKDVEIVAIPRWDAIVDAGDLFGERKVPLNRLYEWSMSPACAVDWIKPGTSDIVPWKVEAQGKYWRGLLAEELKLDLFLTTRDNWGAIYLIRTGSAEFSYAVANHAKRLGRPFKDGWLTIGGQPVATPEERDVFNLLGLEWREPEQRWGWGAAQSCNPAVPPNTPVRDHDPAAYDRFIWRAGDIELVPPDENS